MEKRFNLNTYRTAQPPPTPKPQRKPGSGFQRPQRVTAASTTTKTRPVPSIVVPNLAESSTAPALVQPAHGGLNQQAVPQNVAGVGGQAVGSRTQIQAEAQLPASSNSLKRQQELQIRLRQQVFQPQATYPTPPTHQLIPHTLNPTTGSYVAISPTEQLAERVLQQLRPPLSQIGEQQGAILQHILRSDRTLRELTAELARGRLETEALSKKLLEREEADRKSKEREVAGLTALNIMAERLKGMGAEIGSIAKVLGRTKDDDESVHEKEKSVVQRLGDIEMNVQEWLERARDPEANLLESINGVSDRNSVPPSMPTVVQPVVRHEMATSPIKYVYADAVVSNHPSSILPLQSSVQNENGSIKASISPGQSTVSQGSASRRLSAQTLVGNAMSVAASISPIAGAEKQIISDVDMDQDLENPFIAQKANVDVAVILKSIEPEVNIDIDSEMRSPSKTNLDEPKDKDNAISKSAAVRAWNDQVAISTPSSSASGSGLRKAPREITASQTKRSGKQKARASVSTFSPVDWTKAVANSSVRLLSSPSPNNSSDILRKASNVLQNVSPIPKRSYTLPAPPEGTVAALRQETLSDRYMFTPVTGSHFSPIKLTGTAGAGAEAAERMLSPESQFADDEDAQGEHQFDGSNIKLPTSLATTTVHGSTKSKSSLSSLTSLSSSNSEPSMSEGDDQSPSDRERFATARGGIRIPLSITPFTSPMKTHAKTSAFISSPKITTRLSERPNSQLPSSSAGASTPRRPLDSSPLKPPPSQASGVTEEEETVESLITASELPSPPHAAPIHSEPSIFFGLDTTPVDLLSPVTRISTLTQESSISDLGEPPRPGDSLVKLREWHSIKAQALTPKGEILNRRIEDKETPRAVAGRSKSPLDFFNDDDVEMADNTEPEQNQERADLDLPPSSPPVTQINQSLATSQEDDYDLPIPSSPLFTQLNKLSSTSLSLQDNVLDLFSPSSPATASVLQAKQELENPKNVSSSLNLDSAADREYTYIPSASASPVGPLPSTMVDLPSKHSSTSTSANKLKSNATIRRSPSVISISSDDDEAPTPKWLKKVAKKQCAPPVKLEPAQPSTDTATAQAEQTAAGLSVSFRRTPGPPNPVVDLLTKELSPISDLSVETNSNSQVEPMVEVDEPLDLNRLSATLDDDDADIIPVKKKRKASGSLPATKSEQATAVPDVVAPAPPFKKSLLALPKKGQSAAITRIKKRKPRPDTKDDDEDHRPPLKRAKLRKNISDSVQPKGKEKLDGKDNERQRRSPEKATVKVLRSPGKTPTRRPRASQPRVASVVWPTIEGPNFEDFVKCDSCDKWYHIGCVGIPLDDIRLLPAELYQCPPCEAGVPNDAVSPFKRGQGDGATTKCARPNCLRPKAKQKQAPEEEKYVIEAFVGWIKKFVGGKGWSDEYLVKWHGYGYNDATWEPLLGMGLADSTVLVDAFSQAAEAEKLDLKNTNNKPILLKCAVKAGWNSEGHFVKPEE